MNVNKRNNLLHAYIIGMVGMCVLCSIFGYNGNYYVVFGLLLAYFSINPIIVRLFFEKSEREDCDNTEHERTTREKKFKYDIEIAKAFAELELQYGANIGAINEAYQRLVLIVHPDRYNNKDDPFKRRIEDAYEILMKNEQKKNQEFDVRKAKSYAVLGLQYGADNNSIQEAYRHLISKYHPDHNKDTKAHEQVIVLTDAYKELCQLNK